MEKEMRELCIEGVAIHGDPESCVGVREGVGEALTGVRVGWAIEPRHNVSRGADAVEMVGRQHRWQRFRELSVDPARSKNLCMRGISMRENREVPGSPAQMITGGPRGEG
jgi:RNA-directed DNA polymerase